MSPGPRPTVPVRPPSTGSDSTPDGSPGWPPACGTWPDCPTRWARWWRAGSAPTACGWSGSASRSASSASSTRTAPTSPATPPACASSRATPCCCGARRRRSRPTGWWRPPCGTAWPRPDCRSTPSDWCRTRAGSRRWHSCSSTASSTASSPGVVRRSSPRSRSTPPCRTWSTGSATATSTWTPPPTSTWPRRSWSTPRPSGPACATPPSRSSSTGTWRPSSCPGWPPPSTASPCWATSPPAASCPTSGAATDDDFAAEFLGLTLSIAVVDSLDAAIDHITRFGSGHSEAIVTRDIAAAGRFTAEVDAAAVVVNASTRFVDGGELGLGAEIGISTQKLHARGPMGLRELTSVRYVVTGTGQVRT